MRLANLPPDISDQEIRALVAHVQIKRIDFIRSGNPDEVDVWLELQVNSRPWLNEIAHELEGRVLRGRCLEAYAALFFTH